MKEIFRLCLALTVLCAVSAGVLAFVSAKTEELIAKASCRRAGRCERFCLFENDSFNDMVRVGRWRGTAWRSTGRRLRTDRGGAFEVVARRLRGRYQFHGRVNVDGVIQG